MLAALAGSAILMTGCSTTAAIISAAAAAGTMVAIVVVAKYKANERQKAAAEEQARIATVALAQTAKAAPRKQRSVVEAASKKRIAETGPGNPVTAPVEKPRAGKVQVAATPARPIPSAEEMDKALARELPAYLAVPVPRQQIAAEEGGQATYMLWDTHRQQLATDDVYVLKNDVRNGATVKLDGIKAQVASN